MVPLANAGFSVPVLSCRLARLALFDAARVTVIVSAFVVTPSPAVTNTIMVLGPTDKGMLADADPEGVILPLTVTLAVESLVVGVTVMDDTEFETAAV